MAVRHWSAKSSQKLRLMQSSSITNPTGTNPKKIKKAHPPNPSDHSSNHALGSVCFSHITVPHPALLACRGGDDAMVLVDHLGELTDHQGHRLHPLDLFLRADHLALQVLHLLGARHSVGKGGNGRPTWD